jgi:nitronate monooxygenase
MVLVPVPLNLICSARARENNQEEVNAVNEALSRADAFCNRFGLGLPILLAPMAGACPPSSSIAVMEAGGMGGCGALLMEPGEIEQWAAAVRTRVDRPFQINLWIPAPPPVRNRQQETRIREFLRRWGPPVPEDAGDKTPPDFGRQCEAILRIAPAAVSSIMGLYPADVVNELKARRIFWLATATTLSEAKAAEAAGADVIIAQGMEAGGHRGAFDPAKAQDELVGLFALIPAIADAVRIPVVAAGGIADGRGVAAALMLGASAAMLGTAFLRCPETGISQAWADALVNTGPEQTIVSRAFSGKPGRSIATNYVRAAVAPEAPEPAPYPVQRGLTAAMRADAEKRGDIQRMQAWAGQSAARARAESASVLTKRFWAEAKALLSGR